MMLINYNSLLFGCFIIFCLTKQCFSEDDSISVSEVHDTSKVLNESTIVDKVHYETPVLPSENVYFYEAFDDLNKFNLKWVRSNAVKSDSKESKYDGKWDIVNTIDRIPGDFGLMMNSKAKHHAIASKLQKSFHFKNSPLVLQYDAQFRNGQECGGAYLKLLASPSGDLSAINDKTPYSIMFGPDKCGNEHKLHFIFNHKNPKTGSLREIHWKKASTPVNLDEVFTDGKWHLFRLVLKPDNSFEISLDKRVIEKGSLLEDFNPSVNPPKEIDDPEDVKPEDWDEREKIPDPDAKKPEDWDENEPRKILDVNAKKPSDWLEDEPESIPDPDATRPEDWSQDMDGEWEPPLINNPKCASVSGCGPWKAPLIDNPKYKGKWKPPIIPNPNYQGKWTPRTIPNPNYFEDLNPFKMQSIDAVAFELWTISNGIIFDNVLITSDENVADLVTESTYQIKKEIIDEKTDNWFTNMIKSTNKRPWLWAVYILIIAVPLVLFIGYCCVTPGKKSRIDDPALKKSTRVSTSIDETNDKSQETELYEGEGDEFEGEIEDRDDKEVERELSEPDLDQEIEGEPEEEAGSESSESFSKPRLRKTRARKD